MSLLQAGILSERRSTRPFGIKGGHPGKAGVNLLKKLDGRVISLGPKASIPVEGGDILRIETPGQGSVPPWPSPGSYCVMLCSHILRCSQVQEDTATLVVTVPSKTHWQPFTSSRRGIRLRPSRGRSTAR